FSTESAELRPVAGDRCADRRETGAHRPEGGYRLATANDDSHFQSGPFHALSRGWGVGRRAKFALKQPLISIQGPCGLRRAATQKQASRTRLGCDWPP